MVFVVRFLTDTRSYYVVYTYVQELRETHQRKSQPHQNIIHEFQLLAYYFGDESFDEKLNQMKNISQTAHQSQKMALLISIKNLQADLKTRQQNIQVQRAQAHDLFLFCFWIRWAFARLYS